MQHHIATRPHRTNRGHFDSSNSDPVCAGERRGRGLRSRIILVLILALLPAAAAIAASTDFPVLDGTDDRIIIENAPELNPSEGITIEAWVRQSDSSGCQAIVGKNFTTAYWLGLCNGVIRYYANGSGSAIDGNAFVPLGEWTHVAIAFDGAILRFYIDGILDHSLVFLDPVALPTNTDDLGIGGEAAVVSGDLWEFRGSLAEVRIWSHARSREEIRHDMARHLSGDEEGLAGLWPLDGGFGEAADRHVSFAGGDPSFTVLPAPATLHQPLRVPRLGTTPTIDANCESSEYNEASPLPIWYPPDAPTESPVFGLAGADAFGFFLCLENFVDIPVGSWFEVWFDQEADTGLILDSDDLKFRITKLFGLGEVDVQAFEGDGDIFNPGRWREIDIPPGFDFAAPTEFFSGLELRVSRNDVETADGEVFRTTFGVLWDEGDPTFHGWPRQEALSWEPARILADPPRPDAERPTITIDPIPRRPTGDEPMVFWALATDDVDLRQIEIFVDPIDGGDPTMPEKICVEEVAGEDDVEGVCEFETTLTPGVYSYKARSIDHRGKLRHSRARTLRVTLGGEAPSVEVSHTPAEPAFGEPVTLTATARDDIGIDQISIYYFAPESHTCEPPGSPTEATCSVELDDPERVVRYFARVEDVEALSSASPRRIALVGNDGTDSDGDGLSDFLEGFHLCTNEFRRDTDKDGLEDGWELLGLAFDDGTRLELPDLGAHPCLRDAFLQIDHERGAEFPDAAISLAKARYRGNRIMLHIEENERPRPPTDPMSPLTAPRASFQFDEDGDRYFDPRRNWTHHYMYLSHSVGNGWNFNRFSNVSRYFAGPIGHCLGGDNAGDECLANGECDSGNCGRACADGPLKGTACTSNADCPSARCTDNFECPLDASRPSGCGGGLRRDRNETDIAYRLIHEFGHSVGMGHGGRTGTRFAQVNDDGFFYLENDWNNINHKPNYQSLMNYKAGLATDICVEPPFDTPRFKGSMDYSDGNLPILDETDLDERPDSAFATALRGLECEDSTSPDATPVVIYYCLVEDELDLDGDSPRRYLMISDGTETLFRRPQGGNWSSTPPAHDPGIDWNCDGEIQASVAGSINGSGGHSSSAWGFNGEICDGKDDDEDGFIDEGCDWNEG